MTRDEKIETMARAWCDYNGWNPDHRTSRYEPVRDESGRIVGVVEAPGEPVWRRHIPAMNKLLVALELKEAGVC